MTDLSRAITFVTNLPVVQMQPDELAHYGVLGQRWGHRKDGGRASGSSRQPKKVAFKNSEDGQVTKKKYPVRSTNDHVQSRELLQKKKHELSNSEIQKIVDRLQKEQSLKRLNPSNVERGKQITLSIIAGAGTVAGVYNLVNSAAGQAAIARGTKVVKAILARRP